MNVVKTILLVVFVILCILTVLLVLIQNENSNGMGGVLGGGQTAAFGARSANVVTKTTGVFVVLFFVLAFFLALLNKGAVTTSSAGLEQAAEQYLEAPAAEETTVPGAWIDEETSESAE